MNPAFDGREGGEDIGSAVPIVSMPFADTGATCDNFNDYDEVCPFGGSTAPDVVYSYTPAGDEILYIDLCLSLYDTKVYVYENDEFTPVGCNDDFWYDPPCWTYSSYLEQVVAPGNTYYIVVDGYGGDCGTYDLYIEAEPYVPPVPLECGDDAVPEGEPPLVMDYVDNYNGGCNSTPNVFQDIHWIDESGCGHLAGVSGWYSFTGLTYRDTDWFNIVAAGDEVTVRIVADNPLTLTRCMMTTPNPSCTGYDYSFQTSEIISGVTYEWTVGTIPGANYWVFVAPADWTTQYMEWDYCLEICGHVYDVVPTEEASWGSVKSMYK
jgi:hypothetical protein